MITDEDHLYEPVLVKIVDDFGLPDRNTPEGQLVIAVEGWIFILFVLAGIGGALGFW